MNPVYSKIAKIVGSEKKENLSLSGVDNPQIIAHLLSALDVNDQSPPLVILPDEKSLKLFEETVEFIDSTYNIKYLPNLSSQMYSEITPSVKISHQRLHWLYSAQNNRAIDKNIFVSTLPGLLQNTLPLDNFFTHSFDLKINDELPADIVRTLIRLGYTQSPLVEDPGSFAFRGGILDIFSSAHIQPVRFELFGDTIDSIKYFNPKNQRSLSSINNCTIIPAREVIYSDENRQLIAQKFKQSGSDRNIDSSDISEVLQDVVQWKYFLGCEYFPNYFYKKLCSPLDYLPNNYFILNFNKQLQLNLFDKFISTLKEHYKYNQNLCHILPEYENIFSHNLNSIYNNNQSFFNLSQIDFENIEDQNNESLQIECSDLNEFKKKCKTSSLSEIGAYFKNKVIDWKKQNQTIFLCYSSENEFKQFNILAEDNDISFEAFESYEEELVNNESTKQLKNQNYITLIKKNYPQSIQLKNEQQIFITLANLLGKESKRVIKKTKNSFKKAKSLHFADLKIDDYIVHREHGVAVYKGLTKMDLAGVESEFLQLEYKGKDKLYLPIYRIGQIQKFTGAGQNRLIDKLGGKSWAKAKTKVKSKLKDMAAELLKLYAERNQATKLPLPPPSEDYNKFTRLFPYTETDDQLNAINHVLNDQCLEKPMDRLICGDVGFGKTEVAMRAAFRAALNGQQVALIAPTTILTFQHFENFKKRFSNWPFKICCLNRFVSKKEINENLNLIKSGEANIIVGTHRLFSKDVEFSNLGLLIIDEEQKFGVKHKEKIRSLRTSIDTLTLSATPIPRTLNMSFLGIRDLSLITTAPVDRLPIRTFVSKYDLQTVRKAILNEVERGGQVFFLHNRVNNIETVAQELREEMPHIKFAIGHGQMKETDLEKVMVSFYEKKVDVLISTTIIEAGMDIPNANTIIINNAQNLGLSQLYQLRGRVGRSTKRAYCYLMIPPNKVLDKQALERLKVIQQNSELGSGITIAQYDLELRGSGDLLGANQSGHINAVGYELYMDLLKESIDEQKGIETKNKSLEPEINIRIPALFPDKYMDDIRLRLSYYKRLSDIDSIDEIDQIDSELRDQFGKPPLEVQNLLGVMLIRFLCKLLHIKDLSQSSKGIILMFTQDTPLTSELVFKLSSRADLKYKLTPESKLLIHIKDKTWERIYEELIYLTKKCNIDV